MAVVSPSLAAPGIALMIQPLRRLHRFTLIGLAILLPVAFISGLASRRPAPRENPGFRHSRSAASQLSELLQPFKDHLSPDALVYWSPTASAGEALPPEAQLLGALHGDLNPGAPPPSNGYLVLYSLAHQEVVAQLVLDNAARRP